MLSVLISIHTIFPHYIAAATCLFVLVCLLGLIRLSELNIQAARWILFLCGAHFLFWYGIHALGDEQILQATSPYETADRINFGDPQGRMAINKRLAEAPGKHLVLVRYFSAHRYAEWIHNAADIDGGRVIWALELSPEENAKSKAIIRTARSGWRSRMPCRPHWSPTPPTPDLFCRSPSHVLDKPA